jgi:hypothetical protein
MRTERRIRARIHDRYEIQHGRRHGSSTCNHDGVIVVAVATPLAGFLVAQFAPAQYHGVSRFALYRRNRLSPYAQAH